MKLLEIEAKRQNQKKNKRNLKIIEEK